MDVMTFGSGDAEGFWDGVSAIATVLAVGVALYFGLRDGRHRTKSEAARAEIAKIAIWADLRSMLTAFNLLAKHEALAKARRTPLSFDGKNSFMQIIGSLQEQDARVYQMALDLNAEEGDDVARALAHTRHAVRHAVQLNMYDGTFTPSQFEAKRKAIVNSCVKGRRILQPLVKSSHALLEQE